MPRSLKYPNARPAPAAPVVNGPASPSVDFVAGLIERMHPRERWLLRLRTRELFGMQPPKQQPHPDWYADMQRKAKRPAAERVERRWHADKKAK